MQTKPQIGYPKKEKKKRKKKHAKSIIQRPEDKNRCYLCMLRDDNYSEHAYLETHHVMFGQGRRDKAEADGLTVRLCTDHHHEVHHNADSRQRLCAIAQRAYERTHTREDWMERYKRNYLEV